MKQGSPAWLDVKDLRPGVFWNRDLEAALDASSCVVLLASSESIKSPNVRAEWTRAKQQGKRIIIALFREVKLPTELSNCEVVDFRGAFTLALKRLMERLNEQSPRRTAPRRPPFLLPPWILAISLLLFVPLVCYLLLADWSMHSSAEWLLLTVAIVLLGWILFYSFLRRRMGMTHLLICFAFAGAWTCYPLVLYSVNDHAALANYAQPMVQAITQHELWMVLLSMLPLAGVAVLLAVQPEDLLRWTPTGKAWQWFRARRTPSISTPEESLSFKNAGRFHLLFDPLDEPAAGRLRRDLIVSGAQETSASNSDTTVLLLTNRTRTQWLTVNAKSIQSNMLTIIGARIGLPPELDWLWQREWIDFRHWDLIRLDRKSGLLRVPETVSGTRFPFPVRLAHHLLCAMLGLTLMLVGLVDPSFQNIVSVVVLIVWIWYIPRARGLLRRTIAEHAFYRFRVVSLVIVYLAAIASLSQAVSTGRINPLRIAPVAIFLLGWPILIRRNRPKLTFWFPSFATGNPKGVPSLACKRDWQTLIWVSAYALLWCFVLGLYKS